jgi:hypothetical protein
MRPLRSLASAVTIIAAASCSTAAVSTGGVRCADLPIDSTDRRPPDRKPDLTTIVIPTFERRGPTGEAIVFSFVNRRGGVDSVRIFGTVPDRYHREIRQFATAMRYRPAQRDGCPVATWVDSMVMTFP